MNPQLSPKAIREIREGTCNPLGAPQVTTDLSENIILTSLDDLHNWARLSSLWPLLYGTACCFIEFAALIGSRFDFDRFGLVPRSSPRQADLLIPLYLFQRSCLGLLFPLFFFTIFNFRFFGYLR